MSSITTKWLLRVYELGECGAQRKPSDGIFVVNRIGWRASAKICKKVKNCTPKYLDLKAVLSRSQKKWDVFICHATEDKESVASPLAIALESRGIKVWYDKFSMKWGSSLLQSINEGLRSSNYGIVILSQDFFKKNWPQRELDALFSMMMSTNKDIILPIRHKLSNEELIDMAPIIAGLLNRSSDEGIDSLVQGVAEIVASTNIERGRIKRTSILAELAEPTLNKIGPITESIHHYVKTSFDRENFVQLSQAGAGGDSRIMLKEVFVDLELELLHKNENLTLDMFQDIQLSELKEKIGKDKRIAASDALMSFGPARTVIIGGPGQGKSTLGQFLCQVHRNQIIGYSGNPSKDFASFVPNAIRIPFFVVLKDFAQWSSESPSSTFEKYIAFLVHERTGRSMTVEDVHHIFRDDPTLLVLDGIDEVSEPKLLRHIVSLIKEFLGRCEQVLKSNLQVIVTSRPTSYRNEFESFMHLKIAPLSQSKILEYSEKWITSRNLEHGEAQTIRLSLKESLNDPAASLLMSTPLQITIFLLIIQSGKNPPRQREELFHEYLEIIYKRETSKSKSIIVTEKRLLLGLHQYIGYILHKRAADSADTGANLGEHEFEQEVLTYLRHNDPFASEDTLRQRANQIINESKQRLVLLVELEKGIYGFELRSFQEFFAAAYLVDTAMENDSQQRFRRFYAIAASAHWKNVALFFAGRVGRSHSGSAALILETCRELDREKGIEHLHLGKWLALDLAVDRSFGYSFNEVLQRSAIESGLALLDYPLSFDEESDILMGFRHLPHEDLSKHVLPLLRKKKVTVHNLDMILAIYDMLDSVGSIEELISACIEEGFDHKKMVSAAVRHDVSLTFLKSTIRPLISSINEQDLLSLFGFRFARHWDRLPEVLHAFSIEATFAQKLFYEAVDRKPRPLPRDLPALELETLTVASLGTQLSQYRTAWLILETLSLSRRKDELAKALISHPQIVKTHVDMILDNTVAIELRSSIVAMFSLIMEKLVSEKNPERSEFENYFRSQLQIVSQHLRTLPASDRAIVRRILNVARAPEPHLYLNGPVTLVKQGKERSHALVYLHILDGLEAEEAARIALSKLPNGCFTESELNVLQRRARRVGSYPFVGAKQDIELTGDIVSDALEIVAEILRTQLGEEWTAQVVLNNLLSYEWSSFRPSERKRMVVSCNKILDHVAETGTITTNEIVRLFTRLLSIKGFESEVKRFFLEFSQVSNYSPLKVRRFTKIQDTILRKALKLAQNSDRRVMEGFLKWFGFQYYRILHSEIESAPKLAFSSAKVLQAMKSGGRYAVEGGLLLLTSKDSMKVDELGRTFDIFRRKEIGYGYWERLLNSIALKRGQRRELIRFLEGRLNSKSKYLTAMLQELLGAYANVLEVSDKIETMKKELGLPFQTS